MEKKKKFVIYEEIIIVALITMLFIMKIEIKTRTQKTPKPQEIPIEEKQETTEQEQTPEEQEEIIVETISESIINKYNKLTYKNQKELETLISYQKFYEQYGYNVGTYIDTKLEIKNGILSGYSLDGSKYEGTHFDEEDMNKNITINGIDEKLITITDFETSKYGGPTYRIAALSQNGNLYIADRIETENNNLTLNFKKIELNKNIKGLFINEKYEEFNDKKYILYILTDESELYYLDGYSKDVAKLGYKYEERIINYQPHQNFGFYNINIYKANNEGDIKMMNEETIQIQYNNENLKIKTLFLNVNEEHYIRLFVIDENNNIYASKKSISLNEINNPEYNPKNEDVKDYYELELYNDKKTESIELINEEYIKIKYIDGTTENFGKYVEYYYNAE